MAQTENYLDKKLEQKRQTLMQVETELKEQLEAVSALESEHTRIVTEIDRMRQPPTDFSAEIEEARSWIENFSVELDRQRQKAAEASKRYDDVVEAGSQVITAPLQSALQQSIGQIRTYMWLVDMRQQLMAAAVDKPKLRKKLDEVDLTHGGIPDKVAREYRAMGEMW